MPKALLIIPILTFLIFVHELGHYIFARRAGIRVEEFGFGLPPRLWGIRRGETLWSINWIPLGGFVRVLGEDGKNYTDQSMQSKTAGQRALFFGAGSLMNFLTALVLIALLLFAHGQASSNVYITETLTDAPAYAAGLRSGDRIIDADGRAVRSAAQFRDITQDNLGDAMAVTFARGSETMTTSVVPRTNPPPGEGATGVRITDATLATVVLQDVPADSLAATLGFESGDEIVSIGDAAIVDRFAYEHAVERHLGEIVDVTVLREGQQVSLAVAIPESLPEDGRTFGADVVAQIQFERPSPLRVLPMAVRQFFNYIRLMFEGLVMILNGEIPLSQVAGPIGMGQLTSEIVERATVPSWVAVVTITIILSLNLAILNLLPLPALDGGRLVFVVIEVARRGKRIAPEKEGLVHLVGLVLLLTLMAAVAFMDIDRLISGQSFLQ